MAMNEISTVIFEWYIKKVSAVQIFMVASDLKLNVRNVEGKDKRELAEASIREYFTTKQAIKYRSSGFFALKEYLDLKKKSKSDFLRTVLADLFFNYRIELVAKAIEYPFLKIEALEECKELQAQLELSKLKSAKLEAECEQLKQINKLHDAKAGTLQKKNKEVAELVEKYDNRYYELKKSYDGFKESYDELKKSYDSLKESYEELKQKKSAFGIIKFVGEEDIPAALQHNARLKGLLYDQGTLQNFHIAIRTSPLTILEGVSGTGKSQLVSLYAKTIGVDADHLRILPVSPSWTDDTDILGYYDAEQHKYIEAETELVSMLRDAEKHPDELYIVCFDEMNLAKVEHYFAKFLSLMEKDADEKTLILYSKNQKVENDHAGSYKIRIGDNVRFCGTINIDESTFRLSDKVLDRGIVITLPKLDVYRMHAMKNGVSLSKLFNEEPNFLVFDSYSITTKAEEAHLNESEAEALGLLDDKLSAYDARFGIASRVYRFFEKYLWEMPLEVKITNDPTIMSRAQAFDLLVAEKIIPKIRGTREQVGEIFGRIDAESGEVVDSVLLDVLKEIYNNLEFFKAGKFEYSTQKIKEKARLLETYGYID